jgi:hypothetical protein
MKLLQQNIKVLCFITLCGCIGYGLGNPIAGAVCGLAIVSLVTIVL